MWKAVRKGPPVALTSKASKARAAPPTRPLAPTPVKSRMAAGVKSPPSASLACGDSWRNGGVTGF
eukprot:1936157-Prymnesium_polylepis.1